MGFSSGEPAAGGIKVGCLTLGWERAHCFFLINDGNILGNFVVLREDIKKISCFILSGAVVSSPSIRMCMWQAHELDTLSHGLIGRAC